MTKKSLVKKVWKFLDPPTEPRRRRQSHRIGGSTKSRPRSDKQASGQQKGRGWRCPVCYQRSVPACADVSDGMPCGFCVGCCPGHAGGAAAKRTDKQAEDGGKFQFSVQKGRD